MENRLDRETNRSPTDIFVFYPVDGELCSEIQNLRGGEEVPFSIVSIRPKPSHTDFFVKYYQWVIVLYCLS